MLSNAYDSFLKYLIFQGVYKVEFFEEKYVKSSKKVTEELIKNQLVNICEFHEKCIGYRETMNGRLENTTGKEVEQYKVNIKRLRRDIRNFEMKENRNEVEELLIKKGPAYIRRAEKSIDKLYTCGYLDFMKRSMHRSEICLGDTSLNNLRKTEQLEVITIEHAAYNLVEMDAFYLLNKVKRKKIQVDWSELSHTFCDAARLEHSSEEFLLALLSYPHQFMKHYNKYREKKKIGQSEFFKRKMEEAIEQDGESII